MSHKVAASLVALAALALTASGLAPAKAKPAGARAAVLAAGLEKQIADYAALYLPFDPQTKVTVEKAPQKLAGFGAYRIRRTGRYESLNADAVVFVSNDRKWFFEGDSFQNKSPKPVRSEADLGWISSRYANLMRTNVRAVLTPERDAGGLKALAVTVETGYVVARMPGYVTPDGSIFLFGAMWDFRSDPRAERRRRIDLSAQRAQGKPDAPVTIVEYADMECGYCRYRGQQLDRLLTVNAGIVNARRHYKFFPLWFTHAWAMKAASAGDCLFRLGDAALFRFKELVYGRQETLSVTGIDELAVTSAEGEGLSRADFLSCYLRDESFDRVRRDLEEGYRLGVSSTPTYFIDGTEVSWVEDKVMEDFLRAKYPNLKPIVYEKH